MVAWVQKEVSKLPQYEPVTSHYFADGMYCRVVYREAGVITVGKVHKKEHFYMVIAGAIRVTTDDGVKDLHAPAVLVCSPGTKRIVVSLDDSVCVTVHRTDKRDIEEIEREITEDDPDSMYGPGNILKPLLEKHS
jgi:quercetin dioxygenase-like cupin family protein